MNTTNSMNLSATEARSLLGTLSSVPADIQAAFRHRYGQILSELMTEEDEQQRVAQEVRLTQLSLACRLLLGHISEPVPQAEPDAPGEPAVHEAPQQATAHTATAEAESQPAASIQAEIPQSGMRAQPARHQTNPFWLNAMLTLPLLILAGVVVAFVLHLQQQIQTQQDVLLKQTDQLVQMQQLHQGERRQWLAQLNLQQSQLAEQQQLLQQQQLAATDLQRQLAATDKQLALSQNDKQHLQEKLTHVQQVSDRLIASLCEDSARISPAVGMNLYNDYISRCEQSWQMAAQ